MSRADAVAGPVKAWIEPDRWAVLRATPLKSTLRLLSGLVAAVLGYVVHPAFLLGTAVALLRHAAAEASLRELFRDGMLHPAVVLADARGLIATLVRLEDRGRTQDAVVISRMPRRWSRNAPPWGGERAAMVIAGHPPRLRPLSPDVAVRDRGRGARATARIPDAQWHALESALSQVPTVREGLYPVQLGDAPWYGSVRELEVDGSLPAHLDAAPTHAFCAGLPSVEEPPMADAERRRVERLRRRARMSALALVLGLVALPFALLRVPLPDAVRASALLVLLLLAPLAIARLAVAVQRARAYGRDLRDARVLRFAGALSAFDSLALDRDLALLARRGVFAPEPGVEQDMVVLKDAGELLHANGRWVERRVALHVSELALPPESPIKLSLPRELRSEAADTLDVARRRLTEHELRELSQHALRLRKPGTALLLLTPIMLGALLVWHESDWSLPPHLASVPLAVGMWLLAVQALLRRRRFAQRLESDAQLGWVITVDHGGRGEGDPELPARGVESLLNARLDWTVNRRPATWRRFAR